MSKGAMDEKWADRIAEAVVQKLDEREQINAIAQQVLSLLEQRGEAGTEERCVSMKEERPSE